MSIIGEPVSARRCVGCSTDDVGEDSWIVARPGGWLVCRQCAAAALAGQVAPRAVVAQFRGRASCTRRQMRAAYEAVIAFKERAAGWVALTEPLADALGRSVTTVLRVHDVREPCILAPVPSYRGRRPHVRLLCARAVLSMVDTRLNLLEKTADFRQAAAGRDARRAQSAGAYRVRWWHRPRVRGRVVVVADDILTTGETMRACAAALHDAGAIAVYGAVIVRAIPSPPVGLVVAGSTQFTVRFLETDARGRLPLPPDPVQVWVRFPCGPRCPTVLCAGPLRPPTLGVDATTIWSCRCEAQHAIRLARIWQEGPREWLHISVPPRRPTELLVAIRVDGVTVLPSPPEVLAPVGRGDDISTP